ncbi:MAG: hypothetical protein LBR26_01650 [Prevotella sp.]|nr:hypothetical protein [Prevotella sp.]
MIELIHRTDLNIAWQYQCRVSWFYSRCVLSISLFFGHFCFAFAGTGDDGHGINKRYTRITIKWLKICQNGIYHSLRGFTQAINTIDKSHVRG